VIKRATRVATAAPVVSHELTDDASYAVEKTILRLRVGAVVLPGQKTSREKRDLTNQRQRFSLQFGAPSIAEYTCEREAR